VETRTEPGYRCPCCGYPTLDEPAAYEICCLCNWEDDGQDDHDADEVRYGPNGAYSLAAARLNFRRHWIMYDPDNDTRIGSGDSELELSAKKTMVQAFDALARASTKETGALKTIVAEAKQVLFEETHRRVLQYP
jgi:Cysteine-rich CPCC